MELGTIGKYELLKQLAVGGMAEIYLARQSGPEGFSKLVVIKRILPNLASQDRFVQMFLDEARVAARFNHPNIVQIFDLGREKDHYYIAMEYIPGEDIKSVVRRCAKKKRRIPVEHVVKFFSEALGGLHYAHNQKTLDGLQVGVVHRDVSPHNIIVSFQGGVKLVDFGIAKARSEISTTVPGRIKGKHAYMSPEQVRGRDLDGRSDVFAVGIVLYELLTWSRLFKRKKHLDTLRAVCEDEILPPREINPELDEEIERIVLKALERDLGRRYQSAQQMQIELEDYLLSAGLRSNPALLGRFMSELFADKLDARDKALTAARAADLEGAVLAADDKAPDLVAFLDMFFADTGSSSDQAQQTGEHSYPDFTPSADYTPVEPGEKVPFKTPPPRAPASIADPGTYADELSPLGDRGKGRGILIALFLLVLVAGGVLLFVYRDRLMPEIPEFGLVRVTSIPGGADVYLDGRHQAARTPMDIVHVKSGQEHELEVSLPDLPKHKQKFTLTDTTRPLRIHVVLSKQAAVKARVKGEPIVAGAEGRGTGSIRVTSDPESALIYLDGVATGKKTPATLTRVAAGLEHVVLLELAGKPPAYDRLHLKDGQQASLDLKLPSSAAAVPDRIKVRFESEPEGASISINGYPMKTPTPMSAMLLSGAGSEIEIEHEAHKRKTVIKVRPIPDLDLTVFVKLEK